MSLFERLGRKAESLKREADAGREDEVIARCANCGNEVYTDRESCPECGSEHLEPAT